MTWPWSRPAREAPAYVDTPGGIVASDGTRFHTTEPLLRDYAGPVLDAVGLATLVRQAGVWLRTPQTLAVVALPLLLLALEWWWAAGLTLVLYALWTVGAPGAVIPGLVRVARVLEHPVAQGLLYVGVLSGLAAAGRYGAVWTGIAGFVAFRLGLVEAILRPVLRPALRELYALPPADQTLRSLIVRAALRRGLALPGVEPIEARVREFWQRGRGDDG